MEIDKIMFQLQKNNNYKMVESASRSFDDKRLLSSNMRLLSKNEILKLFQLYEFKDNNNNLLLNCEHFLELLELAFENKR
ncbi:MAG TPA: hypothetical protein PLJ37_00885 [Chitinophagales bacterium]|nr:hypothetical protein [Chitinophagales bacterium]HNG25941.1 hypothetical protein [Chitinophagales bacterium]